ncbi:MAG: hypothetical protein ACRDYA_02875 [Egibacteraceae bacterium]
MSAETARVYRLHGLQVRCALPLGGRALGTTWPFDLDVREGAAAPVPEGPPPGGVIAEAVASGRRLYVACDDGERYLLRYPGLCDFAVGHDLRRIEYRPDPAADMGLVPILLSGTVLAFVLSLGGDCVLHASAVEVDGAAIAIVGQSGMGKSTLAALLCAAGASLLTDDVLRVDVGGAPSCAQGATELRLRPQAESLVGLFNGQARTARTADGRLALRLRSAPAEEVPLAAIVIPYPCRTSVSLDMVEVTPADAVCRLVRFPRVLGWRHPAVLARQLDALVRLATRVPLVEARIPWGPPFRVEVARQLLDRLSHADMGSRSATAQAHR